MQLILIASVESVIFLGGVYDLCMCLVLNFIQEIVPLRKVCRRPETDYRLQQLHALNDSVMVDHQKTSVDLSASTATRAMVSSAEMMQKQVNANIAQGAPLSHSFISVPAQSITLEAKNASASSGIGSGNPAVPPGGAAVISGNAATSATTGRPS